MIARPAAGEYAPYYETYLGKLTAEQTDLPGLLTEQPTRLAQLLARVTDAEAARPTAPGKWSIKQALIHIIDTERVFAYRTMAVARGEQHPLPSFEQDDYVATADANNRALADLLAEHAAQRAATIALLRGLPAESYQRWGTAAGHPVTVRALAWIIAAHEEHHHRLLNKLLQPAANV